MSTLFKGFERIEEAREGLTGGSFLAGLYDGKPDFTLLLTPPQPPEERRPVTPSAGRSNIFCDRRSTLTPSNARPKFLIR